MGTHAGGKINASHSTLIEGGYEIVEAAEKRPEVSKIVLGIIKSGIRNGNPGLKIVNIDHGLKCTIRCNTSVQVLYVYTTDQHATAHALHAVAPKGRGKTRKKGKDERPLDFVDPFEGRRRSC